MLKSSRWAFQSKIGSSTESNNIYRCLDEAINRDLPVAIEEAYGFNPLNFVEADAFLEPILRSYANRK